MKRWLFIGTFVLLASVASGSYLQKVWRQAVKLPIAASSVTATGGTITNYTENATNFTAHIFTNSGTFSLGGTLTCSVCCVAGGGGGG